MKKIFCVLILIPILVFSFATNAFGYSVDIEDYDLNCRNAVVMDNDSGRIIFSKAADEQVSIASTTKIMTAVIVLENCSDLEKTLTVRENDLLPLYGLNLANVGLVSGEQISVYDLLMCLLLPSAADAAMVLATNIGTTVENFVFMMNSKAKLLKMENTHFTNPHGMDEENHYSTAEDLAILTRYAYTVSGFSDFVVQSTYKIPETNMSDARFLKSTNMLITEDSDYYYENACGVKTGYTDDAGRCLVSFAEKNNTRLICVVLGCEINDFDGLPSNKYFEDSIYLFEKMFSEYSNRKVCSTEDVLKTVKVRGFGIRGKANAVIEDDVFYILSAGESVESSVKLQSEKVKGEVKEGDYLGKLYLKFNGKVVGEYSLVAGNSVSRSFPIMIFTMLLYVFVILICVLGIMRFRVLLIHKKRAKMRRAQSRNKRR